MHRTTSRRLLVLLLVLAVALPGCRRGGKAVAVDGPGAADPSTTASAPALTATTTTRATATSTTAGRSSTSVAKTTVRPTTTREAGPTAVAPQQGDRVFSVFLATGPSLDGASFAKAKARLAAIGYKSHSAGDTACSQGAEAALPQLQQYSLSVEFATQGDAERFASIYGAVIGIAPITVYCSD